MSAGKGEGIEPRLKVLLSVSEPAQLAGLLRFADAYVCSISRLPLVHTIRQVHFAWGPVKSEGVLDMFSLSRPPCSSALLLHLF